MAIDNLSYDQWQILWLCLAGFIGLAVGSFINVVVWRIPNNLSLIEPGSHCPKCKKPILYFDNIPVLSFFLLRGKCRNCSAKISVRYPIIEILNAAIWVASVKLIGLHVHTIGYVLFFSGLLALSVIDFDSKLLPKKIVYVSGSLLIVFLLFSSLIMGDYNRIRDSAICALAYFIFLFVIWFASNGKAMGFGDVRLSPFLGAAMGYYGFMVSYMGMLVSFFIGSFVGIAIAVITQKGRKMKIPFGPFLASGTVLAVWFAPQISEWVQGFNV
jgi:leader peptidase (prepilin peptidase)/N-methyltransferase